MEKIANALLSMRSMALGMIVFFIAIARATFIESSSGIQAAKLWVFNALWFEILLAFLGVNLIANIFHYKMWRREKMAVFAFHISFIVILIGAWVTRNYGFEGTMGIREGATTDFIMSSDPYLVAHVDNGKGASDDQATKAFMAESYPFNSADLTLEVANHTPVEIEYLNFQSNVIDSIQFGGKYKEEALEIVTEGKKSNFLLAGDIINLGGIGFANGKRKIEGVTAYKKDGKWMVSSSIPLQALPMTEMRKMRETGGQAPDSMYTRLAPGAEMEFKPLMLYQVAGTQFVFKQIIQNCGKKLVKAKEKDAGSDYLTVRVTSNGKTKDVRLNGGLKKVSQAAFFQFDGLNYQLEYGSRRIDFPFGIKCKNFMILRYPGSETPSSYASDLQVVDAKNNYFKNKRVFMNHVMDYKGYRFFQSSYDSDEKGTILSVNYDWWGTNISYLGYLIMAIGMILSIIAYGGRFRELLGKLNSSNQKILLIALLFGTVAFGQEKEHDHASHAGHAHESSPSTNVKKIKRNKKVRFISVEHSEEVAKLLVQDFEGRIVPFHTVADQLMRKLYRSNKFGDKNAVQNVLSMHMYQDYWLEQKVMQVPSAVREKCKLEDYASCMDLMDNQGLFKWTNEYNTALRRMESDRNEYDKKLIKLMEKFQVFLGVLSWNYMKIVPIPNDPKNRWAMPFDEALMKKDTMLGKGTMLYFKQINEAALRNDYQYSNITLNALKQMQIAIAPKRIIPSKSVVGLEISYNKMNIFKNTTYMYLTLGIFLMLIYMIKLIMSSSNKESKWYFYIHRILIFIVLFSLINHGINLLIRFYSLDENHWSPRYEIFLFAFWIALILILIFFKKIYHLLKSKLNKNGKKIRWYFLFRKILVFITLVIFVYHGVGLWMRWYISGHVPWSNGYEALIFIAWVTMIAGLIFSRKNPAVLAGTLILASFMIMVTELNLLDPEITPLQPVLKSYWLMIHVAVITGSYGFLGLSCILGIVNLVLYITRTTSNTKVITQNINELSYVSELTMTIGLFMLAIGTFLGGIWANESWGRYWGWDPKETWALASVLVYSVILHLRYIPGLKSRFTFNLVSVWGYASILFTFFGVNFILVGLHSYAEGESSVDFPPSVWFSVVCFLLLSIVAFIFNKRYESKIKNLL